MPKHLEDLVFQHPKALVVLQRGERCCVFCEYYRQYFMGSGTNLAGKVAVNNGYCEWHEEERPAVAEICHRFNRKTYYSEPIGRLI